MDDAAGAAVRLPPVARLVLTACLVLALALGGAAPASALALPPAPQRLGAFSGQRVWWSPPLVLAPGPGRWGRAWAAVEPVLPSILSRSHHGRA